jgi:hemoglobin/transferrin/lactoferrin receptor protein
LVDTALQFHLPFTVIDQKTPVYSGSIGIIHSPTDDLKLSFLVSTGFRVPNVDDITKIFASSPGAVIVPNTDLKPERTINYEAGITNIFNEKARWENVVYYTDLYDAIVTDKFKFNGQDSILYDATLSQVYANQNKGRAYVYGFSSNFKSQCSEHLMLSLMLNYTYGRIKTDSSDYPLDHIPPFLSRLLLSYTDNNFSSDFFINFNGWKRLKDYNLGGEDNEQYATQDGMPAWFTLNLHASYKVHKLITLQSGVDNIFDTQYRTFASGINAPGRNIFVAMRFHY